MFVLVQAREWEWKDAMNSRSSVFKTTIGRRIEHTLPLPVKYVYMGVNLDSSNHMLPTTRLIKAIEDEARKFGATTERKRNCVSFFSI